MQILAQNPFSAQGNAQQGSFGAFPKPASNSILQLKGRETFPNSVCGEDLGVPDSDKLGFIQKEFEE